MKYNDWSSIASGLREQIAYTRAIETARAALALPSDFPEDGVVSAGLAETLALLAGAVRLDVAAFEGDTASAKAIAALKTIPRVGIAAHLATPVILDFTRLDGSAPLVLAHNIQAGDGSPGSGISAYNLTPILCLWGGHEVRYELGQYFTSGWVNVFAGGAHVLADRTGARVTGSNLWRTYDKDVLCTAAAASDTLTVNAGQLYQGDGVRVGSAVSVFGLPARDGGDKATLSGAHNASVTTLTFVSVSQLGTTGTILLGTELITYTGKAGNTLTGCTRGAYGTTAGTYVGGEVAQRAVYDVFEVLAVTGTGPGRTIQLDRAVGLTGTAVKATYGATNWAFLGHGLLDANKDPAVDDPTNPHCLLARFVSRGYTAQGLTFANGDHGGVGLTQALHCDIHGTLVDNGRPGLSLGAGLWFFGGVRYCSGLVRVKRGYAGVFIDSRSSGGADTDQTCDGNHVVVDWCDGAARPLVIADGSNNVIEAGTVTNYTSQAATIEALQWGTAALPKKNRIVIRSADLSGTAELVTTNATNGGNVLECETYGSRAGGVEVGNYAKLYHGPVAQSSGASFAFNRAIGDLAQLTATGTTPQFLNPTNCPPGAEFTVTLLNSSGGALAPTFQSQWKLPTITYPTAGKAIAFRVRYDGTRVHLTGAPSAEYTP